MAVIDKLAHALRIVMPPKFGTSFVKLERKHRVNLVDIEENELILNVLITAKLTTKENFRSCHIHQVLHNLYKQKGQQLTRDDIAFLGEEASSIMALFSHCVLSIKRESASRSIPLGRLRALWSSLRGGGG